MLRIQLCTTTCHVVNCEWWKCEKGYVASVSLLQPYHNLFQKVIPSFIKKAFLTLSVGLEVGINLNIKW